jgi:hypothetical protein
MLTHVTEQLPGRVTDPKALRALSHPTRWKLIELLGLEPTATATRCAEFTGESVASCSYHLGILAKYGFVEQAEGGRGREKPWRSTNRRLSISGVGLEPEAALAAEAVTEVFLEHEFGRQKEYLRRVDRETADWQEHTGITTRTTYLTPEELGAARAEIDAVLGRFADRSEDPALRPAGARAVRVMINSYLPLPPERHTDDDTEEQT